MHNELIAGAREDARQFIASHILRTMQSMAEGSREEMQTTNPFSGETMKIRARHVPEGLTNLHARLADRKGRLKPQDQELLTSFMATLYTDMFSSMLGIVTGTGEPLGEIHWSATSPDGTPLYESIYGVTPNTDEVRDCVRTA